MAFVVETGAGLPDANSYTEVAVADAYFADRGMVDWAAYTTEEKQFRLVRATDYIDKRFRFASDKLTDEQALEFPREEWGETVPIKLQMACCEYASRAGNTPLLPDPVLPATGFAVKAETKKVGPITKAVEYQTPADGPSYLIRPYPAADFLLRNLLSKAGRVVIR